MMASLLHLGLLAIHILLVYLRDLLRVREILAIRKVFYLALSGLRLLSSNHE